MSIIHQQNSFNVNNIHPFKHIPFPAYSILSVFHKISMPVLSCDNTLSSYTSSRESRFLSCF